MSADKLIQIILAPKNCYIYHAYTEWCKENGEHPMAQRNFGMRLTERGFLNQRGAGGRHLWVGIGLTSE
jgi:putative DNA primase/helicase